MKKRTLQRSIVIGMIVLMLVISGNVSAIEQITINIPLLVGGSGSQATPTTPSPPTTEPPPATTEPPPPTTEPPPPTTEPPPNNPPYIPSNPSPADLSLDQTIFEVLSWTGGDPDGDNVTYDVFFMMRYPPDMLVSNDQLSLSYAPGVLYFNTNYYWQIIAKDEHGETASVPIWEFSTGATAQEAMDQFQEGVSYGFWFDRDVIRWQEFIPTLNNFSAVEVYLEKNGNPGPFWVYICTEGDLECYGQFVSGLPSSGWVRFDVFHFVIIPGTKHRIYIYARDPSPSPDNRYFWRGTKQSTYCSECENDVIESYPNFDYAFRTYGHIP